MEDLNIDLDDNGWYTQIVLCGEEKFYTLSYAIKLFKGCADYESDATFDDVAKAWNQAIYVGDIRDYERCKETVVQGLQQFFPNWRWEIQPQILGPVKLPLLIMEPMVLPSVKMVEFKDSEDMMQMIMAPRGTTLVGIICLAYVCTPREQSPIPRPKYMKYKTRFIPSIFQRPLALHTDDDGNPSVNYDIPHYFQERYKRKYRHINVMHWNLKGNVRPPGGLRRQFLDNSIGFCPDVLVLYEPRIGGEEGEEVASIFGFSGVLCKEPAGIFGGIWVLWKRDLVQVEISNAQPQTLHATIKVHVLLEN